MKKISKVFKGVIKSIDLENATVHAIVSDETLDRSNEIVSHKAWEKGLGNYIDHPILLSSHDYGKISNTIGTAEKVWVEGKALHTVFRYFIGKGNPEADWGFMLAKEGIAAFSVGFIPKSFMTKESVDTVLSETSKHEDSSSHDDFELATIRDIDNVTLFYTDVELLEISQVTVPCNPSALARSFNSDDNIIQELALKVATKGIESIKEPTADVVVDKETESTDDNVSEKEKTDPVVEDTKAADENLNVSDKLVTIQKTLEDLSIVVADIKKDAENKTIDKIVLSVTDKLKDLETLESENEDKVNEDLDKENIEDYIKSIMDKMDDCRKALSV